MNAKKTLDDYWVPWVDISPGDIDKFRRVLEAAAGEAELQVFLEANPRFLCQHLPAARGYWVISTKRLGSEHVTDFLLGEDTPHQRTWHAVELERPQAPLFTRRGDPANALTHAMRQIDDWRNWLSRNRDYASRAAELSGLGLSDIDPELDGLVIIGRASSLSAAVEDRRRRLARQNRTRIETFDWLISQAEERAKPPVTQSPPFDFLFRKDEFHEMRARRAIESVFGDVHSPTVFVSAIRTVDYEHLLLGHVPETPDDVYVDTSKYEVIYEEVRDHRVGQTTRLDVSDWTDWLNSPGMDFVQRITLLVTEIEPTEELQDSLKLVGEGLWADMQGWNDVLLGAHFLLHLPLDLPLPEKEARCRAARDLMESLNFTD